jgi:hypothetical protein
MQRVWVIAFGLVLAAGLAISATTTAQVGGVVLFGVTGDGGSISETLFIIDPEDASTELFVALGNGDDGEEIAYNPQNGLILHASGNDPPTGGTRVLEWVDPESGLVTPIIASGDNTNDEVTALVYHNGSFLAGGFNNFYRITPTGQISVLGPPPGDTWYTGLAFVGDALYGAIWPDEAGDLSLARVNSQTGAVLSIIDVDSTEVGATRITALASHPCTGQLYAVVPVGQDAENYQPGSRLLVELSPNGDLEVVGDLGGSFAGLTFVGACNRADQREERPRPPNIGAGLSGLFAGQPTPLPTAPSAVAPAATAPVITPPRTGDAGLVSGESGYVVFILAGTIAVAMLAAAAQAKARD